MSHIGQDARKTGKEKANGEKRTMQINFAFLRQQMGLTQAQVADELDMTPEKLDEYERSSYPEEVQTRFLAAFPINPDYVRTGMGEPLLEGCDHTFQGNRLRAWMEQYHLPLRLTAERLKCSENDLETFLTQPLAVVDKKNGERLEMRLGMNRKWLMYGDGTDKGEPNFRVPATEKTEKEQGQPVKTAERSGTKSSGDSGSENAENQEKSSAKSGGRSRKPKASVTPYEQIHALRAQHGLTLKQAGQLAGVSAPRLSQIEHGEGSEERAYEILERLLVALKA